MLPINRIFFSGNLLKEHLAVDHNRSSSQLEQSEDFVSQAWEEQSRELIVLSSPSYVIDVETAWHARQGYWVGKDKRTGDLFFLYPAFSILTTKDLNTFLQHSKEFSESKKCKTSELIVAFRKNEDKVVSPIDSYPQIRFETEQDLLTELIDFTNYIEDIKKQVLTQNLPESLLTLNDVYVPSKLFSSNQQHGHIDNVEDHIVKWIDEPGQRQIALLGEYGQGKSSTALMLTYNLLCISNQLPRRIPIMIELRGKSPRNLNELEFLASWAVKYKIEPHALMRLHIAGRLILIFEGFDEMALIGNSELRLKHFKVLWRFCYQKAKIIITGRPNFFLDDQEMKATLGIIDATSNSPYCEEIRLAPFTIDMIRTALRNQKTSVRDQICLLAEKETRFLDLVSRPSLLHVVATLWERENLYKNPDRLNSAYVMQLFVRNSYRR